jgi:hypothetical protein
MTDQKREFWSNLIAEQEASGQTIRAFCQAQSVGDHCFYWLCAGIRLTRPMR